MIIAMNHITLGVVLDIDKSFAFYRDVLQLKQLVKWDKGAYFLVGHPDPDLPGSDFWFCLNVDEKCLPNPCYKHYGFYASRKSFDHISEKILKAGAPIF